MVIPLSFSSVGCGELGRVLETCYESFSCRLSIYVLWMFLRLHGFTSLDVVSGLVIDLILSFAVGAS